jgi:CBS domain-containing protein
MKVKEILKEKGKNVITVEQNKTVHHAMKTFAANKVGSLLVIDAKNGIIGILAARDVLMIALKSCDKIKEINVKEIMTREIIIGHPDDDLKYVQAIMTENRIRHLPIVENNKLAGIISIGDILKAQLAEYEGYEVENRYLKDYVLGKYPA